MDPALRRLSQGQVDQDFCHSGIRSYYLAQSFYPTWGASFATRLKIVAIRCDAGGKATLELILTALGCGPRYNATEVFQDPQKITLRRSHLDGKVVDWAEVFAGHDSQLDWPDAMVWDQTFAAVPEARVIHTAPGRRLVGSHEWTSCQSF